MGWMGRHSHLVLLAVLVITQVGMALLGSASRSERLFFDAFYALAVLATLVVVCPHNRARTIGGALLFPALMVMIAGYLPGGLHPGAALLFHVSAVAFLAYAITLILMRVFAAREVNGDDVLGAFSGYLLVAILWGNLYGMVYLAAPGSFSVGDGIRWELADWHQRRALFNYLSFATVSSLGYADLTPIAPLANSLTWLEVMAGQFYMAVVVASLVGTKVARSRIASKP
jgi:hypothetical protein